jgi:transposase InsO family protein
LYRYTDRLPRPRTAPPAHSPLPTQTNGKAERFNRTLAEEWAYIRPFHSSADRAAALPGWLHTYNHHRSHSALDGHPPISRITVSNAAGHYI